MEPLGDLVPHVNSDLGFSILYPENWEVFTGDVTQGTTLFVAQASLGVPRVLVSLGFATELVDAQAHGERILGELRGIVAEIEVLEEGPLELADGTQVYEYTIDIPNPDVPLVGRLLVIARGSQVFEIFAQTLRLDFDNRIDDLDRIARSFRLMEPAPFGVTRQNALTLQRSGPSILDPHLITDATSYSYAVQIFSGLVTLDRDLNVIPDLAESWDVLDGGTTYVFHLRRDARFHSGKTVTAEDVKFSLERAADPSTGSTTAGLYLNDIVGVTERLAVAATEVSGVEIIDDFTIRISIAQPVPYFLAKMTHPAAFIVEQANVETGSGWFLQPDGTGPFKLRGWSSLAVVLERNDDYYRGRAVVPYVLFWNVFADPFVMFQAGELDVADIFLSDIATVQDPEGPYASQLVITPELTIFYLGVNNRIAPFDDPRARQAFAMAADVPTIVREQFFDAFLSADGYLPVGLPGYNPDLQPLGFDPERAQALWQEVLAEQGIEVTEITIIVAASSVDNVLFEISQAWEEVLGVTVNFRGVGRISDFTLEATDANFFEFGWIADYPDPQNFLDILFHSAAPNNFGRFSNAQVDALLEEARVESDNARRMALYQTAEELMVQDVAAIPLWFSRNYALVRPDVQNWFFSAQSVADLLNVTLDRPVPPLATPTPTPSPTPAAGETATV